MEAIAATQQLKANAKADAVRILDEKIAQAELDAQESSRSRILEQASSPTGPTLSEVIALHKAVEAQARSDRARKREAVDRAAKAVAEKKALGAKAEAAKVVGVEQREQALQAAGVAVAAEVAAAARAVAVAAASEDARIQGRTRFSAGSPPGAEYMLAASPDQSVGVGPPAGQSTLDGSFSRGPRQSREAAAERAANQALDGSFCAASARAARGSPEKKTDGTSPARAAAAARSSSEEILRVAAALAEVEAQRSEAAISQVETAADITSAMDVASEFSTQRAQSSALRCTSTTYFPAVLAAESKCCCGRSGGTAGRG